MKKVLMIISLAIAGSFCMATYAQTKTHMQAKAHAQTKPHASKHEKDTLKQTTSVTGQAGSWVNNDDYVYNGFYLQTNAEKQKVLFPLYMGSRLKTAVKTGNTITVNGVVETSSLGEKEIMLVSITIEGQTIYDSPPEAPIVAIVEEFVTGTSKIVELQKNKKGVINGFLLDNKAILRVTPWVYKQLSQLATTGANISYTGLKNPVKNGEAVAAEYMIIHCNTITLNGRQYVTK